MDEFIRVKWRGLQPERESTIAAHRFDENKHERLDKPALDRMGKPLPEKYHSDVDELVTDRKQRAGRRAAAPSTSETTPVSAPSGQSADTEEGSS